MINRRIFRKSAYHVFIVFIFLSCSSEVKKDIIEGNQKENSFEGIITYDLSITINDSFLKANYEQYYNELYGNMAIVSINDDGSMFRLFPNSGASGYYSRGFNAEKNVLFQEARYSDTIVAWDAAMYEWSLIKKESGEHDTICDLPCTSINYVGIDNASGDTVSFTYFYSADLFLDPSPYINWKDGFSGEILQTMRSPMLSSEIVSNEYTLNYRAIKIEPKEIADSIFAIPSYKPIYWLRGDENQP